MGDSLLQILMRQRSAVLLAVLLGAAAAEAYLFVPRAGARAGSPAGLSPPADAAAQAVQPIQAAAVDDTLLFTQAEVIRSTPVLAVALADPAVANLGVLQGRGDPLALLKDQIE